VSKTAAFTQSVKLPQRIDTDREYGQTLSSLDVKGCGWLLGRCELDCWTAERCIDRVNGISGWRSVEWSRLLLLAVNTEYDAPSMQ